MQNPESLDHRKQYLPPAADSRPADEVTTVRQGAHRDGRTEVEYRLPESIGDRLRSRVLRYPDFARQRAAEIVESLLASWLTVDRIESLAQVIEDIANVNVPVVRPASRFRLTSPQAAPDCEMAQQLRSYLFQVYAVPPVLDRLVAAGVDDRLRVDGYQHRWLNIWAYAASGRSLIRDVPPALWPFPPQLVNCRLLRALQLLPEAVPTVSIVPTLRWCASGGDTNLWPIVAAFDIDPTTGWPGVRRVLGGLLSNPVLAEMLCNEALDWLAQRSRGKSVHAVAEAIDLGLVESLRPAQCAFPDSVLSAVERFQQHFTATEVAALFILLLKSCRKLDRFALYAGAFDAPASAVWPALGLFDLRLLELAGHRNNLVFRLNPGEREEELRSRLESRISPSTVLRTVEFRELCSTRQLRSLGFQQRHCVAECAGAAFFGTLAIVEARWTDDPNRVLTLEVVPEPNWDNPRLSAAKGRANRDIHEDEYAVVDSRGEIVGVHVPPMRELVTYTELDV